jgi:type IV pilus assembly protein PilN
MRIPINLSSEPFHHDRAALVVSAVCSVLLVGLLAVQGYLILGERSRAEESRNAVGALQAQLGAAAAEQARIDAVLRQPANAEVLQQSVLLNALIERKSISWARLLTDIGGVLPNNARMVQVRLPQVNSRNQVTLDMEVGAQSRTAAIDFTTRLENSELFGPATLLREDPPSQNEPLYRYRLTVSYGQKY